MLLPLKNKQYWLFVFLCATLTSCAHSASMKRNPFLLPTSPDLLPIHKPKVQPAKVPLKPNLNTLIVLDPGHGGKDLGTYSTKNQKYQEKYLTLSTSKMLKNYLESLGYKVLMTRDSDRFVTLEDRASLANENDSYLFISVHYNSAPNPQAEGIEIFYFVSEKNKKRTKISKNLAEIVLKQTLASTGAKSRGVKEGDLRVIRNTNMPAILIEGGFLTNEEERNKIKSAEYQKKIAWGIAQGIQEFLSKG